MPRLNSSSRYAIALAVPVLMVALGGPLVAETIGIRTAEHEGFTRIVVDFDDRPAWRLGRLPQGYGFRGDDPDIEYDTSGIYRRISRNRLSELTPDGNGGFDLVLGCNCSISTIEVPNGWLVIDISQSAPTDDNPYEVALSGEPAVGGSNLPATLPPREMRLFPGLLTDALDPDAPGAERRRRSAATREYLRARIVPDRTVDDGGAGIDTGTSLRAPLDRLAGLANISVVDPIAGVGRGGAEDDETVCIDPDRLDVAMWGDPDSADRGLGDARMSLVDTGGRPDPEAFAALARSYVYLSFGAEAETLLRTAPDDTPDRELLLTIAGIVDGRGTDEPGLLADQADCPGPVGMWAALAIPPEQWKGLDGGAVSAAFSPLPSHLRHHLGPLLVGRFVTAGDEETARLVRNAMRRDPGSVHRAPALELARLDEMDGDVDRAAAAMADVAVSNRPDADAALIALVSGRIQREQIIGEDLLGQLEERAYAARGTSGAGTLAATRVRALRNNGSTGDAMRLLEAQSEPGPLSGEQASELYTALYSDIATLPDDAEFLTLTMPRLDRIAQQTSVRVAIGARLAALGLADQARQALGSDAAVPGPDERLARAEIAILEKRLEVAKSYLAGMDDPATEELRARISRIEGMDRMPVAESPVDIVQATPVPSVLGNGREVLGNAQDMRRRLAELLAE